MFPLLIRAGIWGLGALGLDNVLTNWFHSDGEPKTDTVPDQVAGVGKALLWLAVGGAAAGAITVILVRQLKGRRGR